MAEFKKAAFFRVEGTLVRRPSVHTAAWLTLNTRETAGRVTRLGGVAMATGFRFAGTFGDQQLVQRMTWLGLRGMSHDRLAVLGREYYERFIEPNLLDVGIDLLSEARLQGYRVVLLSENLDVVMHTLTEKMNADDLICNSLEMRNERATGRLKEPLIGGNLSGHWARSWATDHTVDLEHSSFYGASGADSLLMNAIGKPCAVNPDRRLRRIARDLDWPVVDR